MVNLRGNYLDEVRENNRRRVMVNLRGNYPDEVREYKRRGIWLILGETTLMK